MPRDQLAALVVAARKQAGYETLYACCKATGISTGTLSDIESGRHAPTVENLERVMDAIGCNVVVTFPPRKRKRKRSDKP